MRKIAVLVIFVLLYPIVTVVAEPPEITEARIAGEKDAKSFHWPWFAAGYLISNASPVFLLFANSVIEEYHLYDGILDTIHPNCYLAAYGIYVLAPTTVALLHSPPPPADRLLGKSPEWVNAYTKAYQKGMKRYRTEASLLGCVAGTVALLATSYVIFILSTDHGPG